MHWTWWMWDLSAWILKKHIAWMDRYTISTLLISAAYLSTLVIFFGACCVPDCKSSRGGIQCESKSWAFWATNWDNMGNIKEHLLPMLAYFQIKKQGKFHPFISLLAFGVRNKYRMFVGVQSLSSWRDWLLAGTSQQCRIPALLFPLPCWPCWSWMGHYWLVMVQELLQVS